jgi:cellulose synthase/poly-beta-1,6-N-acetylglucosamine synthase-like glycosyltransferase
MVAPAVRADKAGSPAESSRKVRDQVEIVFWVCALLLVWTLVGYPAAVLGLARVRPLRLRRVGAPLPSVSVLLAVRNGAADLPGRVENLLAQRYPADRLEVIIACNGGTDGTDGVAQRLVAADPRVRVVVTAPEDGKAGSLNAGAALAAGEVLVFADARQRFAPDAVRRLVRPLRDPSVGGVTGRLLIGRADSTVVAGTGSYWALETRLRMAEGRTGSVVGATGAIYAMRASLFTTLPSAVILDDVYQPMHIVRQGYRIAMAPRALAFDRPSKDHDAEYRRRVRTLVGNLELVRLAPWLLAPRGNPIFVRYVSHKLLRVLIPVLCVGLVVSGIFLPGLAYRGVVGVLLLGYLLGALGLVAPIRVLALPSAFLLLHTAGFAALMRPARRASDVWAS